MKKTFGNLLFFIGIIIIAYGGWPILITLSRGRLSYSDISYYTPYDNILYVGVIVFISGIVVKTKLSLERERAAQKMKKKDYIKKYSDGTHGSDREKAEEWEDSRE